MRFKSFVAAGVVSLLAAASASQAAVLYQATALNTYKGFTGVANGTGLSGVGDDYNIGSPSFTLTGLTFTGGLSVNTDSVTIRFYDASGAFVTSITPASSEVLGNTSSHTLSASDFGAGINLPGKGYIIFTPSTTVVDQAPRFTLAYGIAGPTIGTTDTTFSAKTDESGVISSQSLTAFGSAVGTATMEFDGVAAPEPASLAVMVPVALALVRRRKA